MNKTTITISGKGVESLDTLNMQISVEAVVDVDAKSARRVATAWLASEVGNMLIAGDPRLVIAETTVWRLPVLQTSSQEGILGEIGFVDVDAATGEPQNSDTLKAEILKNVQRLGSSPHSSTG